MSRDKSGLPLSASKPRHAIPALSPESRENQITSLAMDLAEKQIRNGTASSQVITHFLQLGATKTELEKEKLRNENELLKAKKKDIESNAASQETFEKALKAFKSYSGDSSESNPDNPTVIDNPEEFKK